MRGLRTIPVMIAMADEMADRCPDGLLLNYANPMAMVPWGIWAGSRWAAARTVGVCHSVRDTHCVPRPDRRAPPRSGSRSAPPGFNHQCFVYVFRDRETDEDLYPRLRQIVEADPEGLGRRARVEMFRRFGYFPTESSEHTAEYVPWFLHQPDQVERFRTRDRRIRPAKRREPRRVGRLKAQLDAGEEIELERNDELASRYVCALETGTPTELYGNVRNEALIEGLPDDACVEVPVRRGQERVQPTRIGRPPRSVWRSTARSSTSSSSTVRAASKARATSSTKLRCSTRTRPRRCRRRRSSRWSTNLIEAHGDLIPEAIRRG